MASIRPQLQGAYFTSADGQWMIPTDHSRGPWDKDSCHAGPPTGLLARAMESVLADKSPQQRLVRLTVVLSRPIPMAGFHVVAGVERLGRSVTTLQARIVDGDGQERATATGLAMRANLNTTLSSAPFETHRPDDAVPGEFPLRRALHDLPTFVGSVQLRYPPGQDTNPGPTTVWMRTVPLLEGETPSPFQRLCPLADCGNAFSRNAEPWEVAFVNPDLTILMHRPPDGEWLGSSSASHWQPTGIGVAEASLFDRHGPIGSAMQTLLLSPQH